MRAPLRSSKVFKFLVSCSQSLARAHIRCERDRLGSNAGVRHGGAGFRGTFEVDHRWGANRAASDSALVCSVGDSGRIARRWSAFDTGTRYGAGGKVAVAGPEAEATFVDRFRTRSVRRNRAALSLADQEPGRIRSSARVPNRSATGGDGNRSGRPVAMRARPARLTRFRPSTSFARRALTPDRHAPSSTPANALGKRLGPPRPRTGGPVGRAR